MNKSRKKSTWWNIIFQYYSVFFSVISGIILLPIYLKFIKIDLYGGWLATGNFVYFLSIIDPGISDVLRLRTGIAYGKKNKNELGFLLTSGIILSFLVAFCIIVIGYLFYIFIFNTLNITSINFNIDILRKAFLLSILGTSLMIFSYCLSSFNQGLLRSKDVGIIYLIGSTLSIIFTVILLYTGFGIYSIPIGQIICAIILILGNFFYTLKSINQESIIISFKYSNLIELLKLSGFNIIGKLGVLMSSQLDSILITKFLNPAITTVFSITRKGPEISRLFIERSPIGIMPAITNAWGVGELDKVKYYTTRLIIISIWLLGFFFSSFLLFNKMFINLWIGKEYYAGDLINILICLCIIFSVIISITSNLYFAIGNVKQTSKIFFLQGLLTLIFSILGIKYYGLIGLVSGQLLGMLIFSIWYFPIKLVQVLNFDTKTNKKIFNEILVTIFINCLLIIAMKFFFKLYFINNWYVFIFFTSLYIIFSIILLLITSFSFNREFHLIKNIVTQQVSKLFK